MKMLRWTVPGVLVLSLLGCGGGTDGCKLTLGGMACGSVTPDNVAPVARTGPNQQVNPDQVVTLDGSMSTDANNTDRLTYTWTWLSQPTGSALTLSPSDAAVKPTFTPVLPGEYRLRLTVSDGQLSSSAETLVSVVRANVAPVANAGPNQRLQAGRTVNLDGSKSSDVDGDSLTVSAVRDHANGHASIVNGQVQFVANSGFTGAASFDYLTDDGNGGQAWATSYVTVKEPPTCSNKHKPTPMIKV